MSAMNLAKRRLHIPKHLRAAKPYRMVTIPRAPKGACERGKLESWMMDAGAYMGKSRRRMMGPRTELQAMGSRSWRRK